MVSAHEVKLAVINNPGVNAYAIAAMIGVSPTEVYNAMNALNINRKSKPADCVG
ncbi:hypothetical protein NVP1197A_64 [Vibrio phage 1.197.A._10N.286.54.F2]|nr:hypothetical protein NVP1197A_64 [Vibrio phage 1.197.A._10N.286.54.F2]